MIQTLTRLACADNSGAITLQCIGVLKGAGRPRIASIGRVISVSIKKAKPIPNNEPKFSVFSSQSSGVKLAPGSDPTKGSTGVHVRAGEVHHALIVRCRKEWQRADGRTIKFDDNAAILLAKTGRYAKGAGGSEAAKKSESRFGKPIGTRVFGPVPAELRKGGWLKLLSLSSKVI